MPDTRAGTLTIQSHRGAYTVEFGTAPFRGLGAGPFDGCHFIVDARVAELYARELAKGYPEAVRQVIPLGTPFTGHPKATNAWRLYEFVTGHKIGTPEIHEPLRTPPPVPTTSIFSRSDGVVAWQCSVEQEGPLTENIEVEASHLGMGLNPMTFYAIADRLAQPEGEWKPFERSGLRSMLYRNPRRRGWF